MWAFPVGIYGMSRNHRQKMGFAERLRRFMSSTRGLDGLYSEVLQQAFDAEDNTVMSRFTLLIGRILATKEPLSVSAHSALGGEDDPVGFAELILPVGLSKIMSMI
jgi:hypothetical protein